MKMLTVVGARPQFIKASALSRTVRAASDVSELLVHTGQHYDDNMSDIFFRELGMPPPDRFLGIGGQQHGAMTGKMLTALEELMLEERPDVVLVYGDTNSTLAGALAAAKLHIPIAHVEAGLRSFNRRMPEEINRVLSDHASQWLFCPTEQAVSNLAVEGITANVHNVGDIMYDVALYAGAAAKTGSGIMGQLGLEPRSFVLATVHRQENTNDLGRLRNIFAALAQVSHTLPVILPLHPRTRQILIANGIEHSTPGLRLIDPLGYLDMAALEQNASVIATDSGGVQKEAFFYGVPCVTLRDETEWTELVETGWNRLADVESPDLAATIVVAIGSSGRSNVSPYGDGNTAGRILSFLRS